MQSSPTAPDETGDTEREQHMNDKPTKMKEVTWVRFIVGDAIQGEIKTTIDFPDAKMAADYIRQMPYLVDASSSDVIDYITQDWTDDSEEV